MLRNVLDLAVKIVASATILFFLALAVLVSKEDKREEKLPTNLASAVQIAASDSSPSATLKAQEWAYSHQADDMARGIINEAWIKSQNKFEFSSPYD